MIKRHIKPSKGKLFEQTDFEEQWYELCDDYLVFVEKSKCKNSKDVLQAEDEEGEEWKRHLTPQEVELSIADQNICAKKEHIASIDFNYSNKELTYYVTISVNGRANDINLWFNENDRKTALEVLNELRDWWLK